MKIKAKLLTLIIVMITSMTLSVAVYAGFNIYTNKLENEKNYLQLYRNSINESHAELFRFLLDGYEVKTQLKTFNIFLENKKKSFENIKEITLLPNISSEIEQALGNITNLESYQTDGLKKFYSATDDLLDAVVEVMKSSDKFILNSLSASSSGFSDKQLSKLRFYIKKTKKEINFLEIGFQTSLDIIDEQYSIIDARVLAFENLGNLITIGIFIFVLILSLIIASIISGRIAGSVKTIGSSLSVMATGDLTHEISVNTSDEIGVLSGEMNTFQDELNDSLNRIKRYSKKNEEIKNYLINTATEASSASVEISANINSVDKQIITLNNNILTSTGQVSQISSYTNDLNSHISDQMAMVEESTASITEMIASIASVSSLTDKNQQIMVKLEDTAKEGDNQINETTDRIEDINASMHNIGAMAEVIQNISDQTNLLAMNAAIEAAHAGDAGKGFAVVADEIRKLSEASASSSKDIAVNLQDIIKKFEKASVSGVNTREAFGNIYDNIKLVSNSLLEIASSTSELNLGGTQILEAMDSLSDISSQVQNKSSSMKENAESVQSSMGQVSDISSVVTEAMAEVNVGFSEVKESIAGLEKISAQVGHVSRDLNLEVDKFKTGEFSKEITKKLEENDQEV